MTSLRFVFATGLLLLACGDDGDTTGAGGSASTSSASTSGASSSKSGSGSSSSTSSSSSSSSSSASSSASSSQASSSSGGGEGGAGGATATASSASGTGGAGGGGGGDPLDQFCVDNCAFANQLEADLMCGHDNSNCLAECNMVMVDPQCVDELIGFGNCLFALPSSDFGCDPQGYTLNSNACQTEIDAFFNCP